MLDRESQNSTFTDSLLLTPRAWDHEVYAVQENQTLSILVFSMDLNQIVSNTGIVMEFGLSIPPGVGTYLLDVNNIKLI